MSKVSLKKEKIKYCIEYDDNHLFKYKICKTLSPDVKECDVYHKKMVELVIDNESYVSPRKNSRLSSESYVSSKSYVSICAPNGFKLEV
jgi:hypothetical protein